MAFGEGKIWMDGEFIDWKEATVNVMAHVVHYGSSVFESTRVYKSNENSLIFRADAHIDRLYESSKIYRMKIPYTKNEFKEALIETVKINNLKECYIRPIIYRGFGSLGVNPEKNPINCAIAAWEWGAYLGDGVLEKGVSAKVSSWNRAAPNTFPSLAKAGGNYINSQLIVMEAHSAGYDEGIALDSFGYVSEGSGENVFIVKNGVLFTPPTSSSILAGITRHTVFVLARDMGLRIEQHVIPREALYIADEVFFTGTAAEITPITSIDGIEIGEGKRGPITEKIQKEFFDVLKGNKKDKYGWLTKIY